MRRSVPGRAARIVTRALIDGGGRTSKATDMAQLAAVIAALVLGGTGSVEAQDPPPPLPSGRAIAALDGDACVDLLRAHEVSFEPVETTDGGDVHQPVRITGPIGGVEVARRARRREDTILDCRLVVALLAW